MTTGIEPLESDAQKKLVTFLTIALSCFALYASLTQAFEAYLQRTLFLGFTLIIVFLTRPVLKARPRLSLYLIDIPLILLSLIVVIYASAQHYDLLLRAGASNQVDRALGTVLIILIFEATRRTVGWPILLLTLILITYTLTGPYLPLAIGHAGSSWVEIIELNYMSLDGVYGIVLGVMVEFVIVFTIFGAMLEKSGGVKKFSNFAQSVMGGQAGGAAKTAVLASGIMGTLSGSSAANVVTTGAFTIPMMKRLGYSPTFAGAVEAAASTGGQIMPPIMGASAFVIMGVLGISYFDVCKAAFLPACLYFLSVGACVHFVSKKEGLRGLSRSELPPIRDSFIKAIPLIIPVFIIIGLLVTGYTPVTAGFWAIIGLLLVTSTQKDTRLNPRKLADALSEGSRSILSIVMVAACAGIIVSTILITGLGMRISAMVTHVATINAFLGLILAAVACIVLGMGMPTVGAYIVVATLGAPALIGLGFSAISTHMFVFYYAILSNVTPPIALAAYSAAPLAGPETNAMKIGFKALSFTLSAFVIPFVFILDPDDTLLLRTLSWYTLYHTASVCIGVIAVSIFVVGFSNVKLKFTSRVFFGLSSIFLFNLNLFINLLGIVLFILLVFIPRWGQSSFVRRFSFSSSTQNDHKP